MSNKPHVGYAVDDRTTNEKTSNATHSPSYIHVWRSHEINDIFIGSTVQQHISRWWQIFWVFFRSRSCHKFLFVTLSSTMLNGDKTIKDNITDCNKNTIMISWSWMSLQKWLENVCVYMCIFMCTHTHTHTHTHTYIHTIYIVDSYWRHQNYEWTHVELCSKQKIVK